MGESAYGASRERDACEPGAERVVADPFAGDGLELVDVGCM